MSAAPVIAVDGPAGSGKSSTSKGVARAMGLRYLDTGAMYRAITWAMLQRGVDVRDSDAVALLAEEPSLEITTTPDVQRVVCDGVDITSQIRSPEVTAAVSAVSAVPAVRSRLVRLQRAAVAEAIGSGQGIVVEGRDIGTVVLPDATLKVFLTADARERAARRAREEAQRGEAALETSLASTLERLTNRDGADSTRAVSPLAAADDAVRLDGSDLTLEQVIDRVVSMARERARNG